MRCSFFVVMLTAFLAVGGLFAQQAALEPEPTLSVYRVVGEEGQLAAWVGELRSSGKEVVIGGATLDRGFHAARALLNEAQHLEVRSNGLKTFLDQDATQQWNALPAGSDFAAFARELDNPTAPSRGSGFNGFPCYRTVEDTQGDLIALAAANPTLATWMDWGDSWEATYDVGAIRITNSASAVPKAPFVIIAATHAREYTTAETATRFAEMLVNGYGIDPEITAILDTTEIHIVPVHNPDGRKQAEVAATDLWRKNTNDTVEIFGGCSATSVGVDLNRNSLQFWREGPDGGGYSSSSCAALFSGPSADPPPNDTVPEEQEPETLAITALMAAAFIDQRGPGDADPAPADATGLFISLHSFGEYILYPWEAKSANPPNHDDLRSLGRRMGSYLPDYTVCQDCFGTAAGTNVEEAYGRYGVASYTWELGTTFHQACSTFENTIFPDVKEALLFAAKGARRPYQEPQGPEVIDVTVDPGPVTAGTLVAVTGTADDTRYSFGPGGDSAPEAQHNVAAVYYSIDAPPFTLGSLDALQPADGLFGDEMIEAFTGTIDTTGLLDGVHLVYLVAEDSTGQKGVTTAVFIDVIGPLFADGFESGNTSAW